MALTMEATIVFSLLLSNPFPVFLAVLEAAKITLVPIVGEAAMHDTEAKRGDCLDGDPAACVRIEAVSAVATMAVSGSKWSDGESQDTNDQNRLNAHVAYLLDGRCNCGEQTEGLTDLLFQISELEATVQIGSVGAHQGSVD